MKPKKWVNPCDLNSPLGEYVYLGQESFLSKYATGSSGDRQVSKVHEQEMVVGPIRSKRAPRAAFVAK